MSSVLSVCDSPPLLLADSSFEEIPQHVVNLVLNMMKQLDNPTDENLLVVLLFVLMMETGFTPVDSDVVSGPEFNIKLLRSVKTMPENWMNKDQDEYKLRFKVANLGGPDIILKINKFITSHLIVTLYFDIYENPHLFKDNPEVNMMHITTSEFVGDWGNPTTFQKVKALSNTFKDTMSFPMISQITSANNLKTPNFEGIPVELNLEIFKHLPIRDIISLSETCKYMNNITSDQELWRIRMKNDNPGKYKYINLVELGGEINWRLKYKWEFKSPIPSSIRRFVATQNLSSNLFKESMRELRKEFVYKECKRNHHSHLL